LRVSSNARYEEDEIILLYLLHWSATALYLLVSAGYPAQWIVLWGLFLNHFYKH